MAIMYSKSSNNKEYNEVLKNLGLLNDKATTNNKKEIRSLYKQNKLNHNKYLMIS